MATEFQVDSPVDITPLIKEIEESDTTDSEIMTQRQPEELSPIQVEVLWRMTIQASPDQIADRLDVDRRKVFRIVDGLTKENKEDVEKWHCKNIYLQRNGMSKADNSVYELTSLGIRVLAEVDATPQAPQSDTTEEDIDFGEMRLRPHNFRSEHSIRFSTGEFEGSWFQFVKNEMVVGSDTTDKYDTTDGKSRISLPIEGLDLLVEDYRVEVYEQGKVIIQLDYPERTTSVQAFWNKYLFDRKRILNKVGNRLRSILDSDVTIVSSPEHCEASMLQQEWAVVGHSFAEWFYENRDRIKGLESQRDGRADFVVRDESGDPKVLIDRSEGEPELEFVDGEEGKLDAELLARNLMYMTTQEFEPRDIQALSDLDETILKIQNKLDRVGARVDDVSEKVEELEESVPEGLHERMSELDALRRSVEALETQVEDDVEEIRLDLEDVKDYAVQNVERMKGDISELGDDIEGLRSGVTTKLNWLEKDMKEAFEKYHLDERKKDKQIFKAFKTLDSKQDDLKQVILKNNDDVITLGQQNVKQEYRLKRTEKMVSETEDKVEELQRKMEIETRKRLTDKLLFGLRSRIFGKILDSYKWKRRREFVYGDTELSEDDFRVELL